MDTDLRCNHLNCRKPLIDKAVVTTCSHIFCVECANELFNASRLCPACESSLSEPDDVVVCSLHPTDDYKTSVLSGLSPSIIMEICSRSLSFWQYQIHQERLERPWLKWWTLFAFLASSFQQAVSRNLNDRNAQLQKQLENVIREANGEIRLLGDKITELERDLELERRKVRELQDTSREREKEYQRLKAQLDKVKRKALLGPDTTTRVVTSAVNPPTRTPLNNTSVQRQPLGDVGAVMGGMQASGIQRTPFNNRTVPMEFGGQPAYPWSSSRARAPPLAGPQRLNPADRSFRANSISDQSESANEVENLLLPNHNRGRSGLVPGPNGWGANSGRGQPVQQRPFNPAAKQRGFTR